MTLLPSSCNKEDDNGIENTRELEEYLLDEMEDQNIPAMAVLLFDGANVRYEKYLGKSNVQQNLSLQDDHLFLLASISKVVTATALLQLSDQGLLKLDDKINSYLPFTVNVPGQTKDITFRMLLTHTSGIADGSALDNQYYYGMDSPIALDYFLLNYLTPNGAFYNAQENFHSFEPGSQYEYSNTGNALIGMLVQQITGTDFNTYCKQNIFDKLGMTESYWRLDEITQTIVQPYDDVNGQNEVIQHYTFTDYPNGGLRSTARDLHKLLTALVSNGSFGSFTLLQAQTVEAMTTLQIPTLDNTMGLHLFRINTQYDLWGHDGGEQGVSTIMAFNKDNGKGAIILTNQGEADLDDILVEAYKIAEQL